MSAIEKLEQRLSALEAEVAARLAKGEPLKGPVDHAVPVMTVTRPDKSLVAILFGYACHPTTLSFTKWCGDYPGFAQLALEKKFPGATALFGTDPAGMHTGAKPPAVASGIRVGTPGPATIGMDEPEMKEVARVIGDVLRQPQDQAVKERARQVVGELMSRFPVYPG